MWLFFSIIIYTCEHIVNPWHPVTVLNTPCKFKAAITRYQGFRWCWHWPWWHWWSHTYPVPTPQAACDPGVRIAGLWLGSCSIWWFATKFHTALFTDFISIPGLLWVVRAAFPGWLNLEEYIIVCQVFGRGTDPDTYSISMYIPWHMQHMLMPCHVTAHPGDKYAVYSYYGTFTRAMLTLFDAWTDKNLGSGTKVQTANLTPGVEIGSWLSSMMMKPFQHCKNWNLTSVQSIQVLQLTGAKRREWGNDPS